MHLDFHLSHQQNLKLAFTPELRQSIDILQIHLLELTTYLQEMALANPIIEIDVPMLPIDRKQKPKRRHNDAVHPMASIKADEFTLEEWLLSQLRLCRTTPALFETASFLAGSLNDDGYLAVSLEDACAELSQPVEHLEQSLELLQSLDPPGVGARSLQECLLIQMKQDQNFHPMVRQVVEQYFIELAQGKFKQIAKKCKISMEEFFVLFEYIRSLNPRPGLPFNKVVHQFIVPDAEIVKIKGHYCVQLFEGHLPKISFNQNYCEWAKNKQLEETSSFLKEKLHEAHWIVKSLKQRKATLYRVIQAILEEQTHFFVHGGHELMPMKMKALSIQLGMHESTVSRAVQNKYVQTPYGIFELKYFFSSGLASKNGYQTSRVTLKHEIQQLIDKESKQNPLSDNLITEILAKEGVQISRRTVTKYRKEMQILSSTFRRR